MISFNPLPSDTYHGSADDTSGELRRLAPGTVSMKKRIRLNNNGSLRILPVLRWAPRRKFKTGMSPSAARQIQPSVPALRSPQLPQGYFRIARRNVLPQPRGRGEMKLKEIMKMTNTSLREVKNEKYRRNRRPCKRFCRASQDST